MKIEVRKRYKKIIAEAVRKRVRIEIAELTNLRQGNEALEGKCRNIAIPFDLFMAVNCLGIRLISLYESQSIYCSSFEMDIYTCNVLSSLTFFLLQLLS